MERVFIIGTGLIGASTGLALRAAGFAGRIDGWDTSSLEMAAAVQMGAIDGRAASREDTLEMARLADVIVLAVPVLAIMDWMQQLAPLLRSGQLVTDVGSTKVEIVELAGRLFARDPERAAAEIADVEMISRKALGEVREAIRGYRAEGLTAAIKRAHSTLDAAGVTLECEEKPPALNPAIETVISLIVREAVTNIVRHAHASRCSIHFSAQNGHTSLIVEDDGRGGVRLEGNGLRGMRERIEALGGQFAVDGSRGTRLTIQVPTDLHSELKA